MKMATSNSGLTPMKEPPTGFTRPFQLNCRFRTWSSSSGYRVTRKINKTANDFSFILYPAVVCTVDQYSHSDTAFPYTIFVVPCFVAFVVHMLVFFLQIELDPVVQTHDLLPVLGFSHKHMFKSTGILPTMNNKSILKHVLIEIPHMPSITLQHAPL